MATILLLGLFYTRLMFLFFLNQTSFTPNELVRRRRVIWALCAFQVRLFVSSLLVENEIFVSQKKGTGAQSNTMATSKCVSFCFLPDVHFCCQDSVQHPSERRGSIYLHNNLYCNIKHLCITSKQNVRS